MLQQRERGGPLALLRTIDRRYLFIYNKYAQNNICYYIEWLSYYIYIYIYICFVIRYLREGQFSNFLHTWINKHKTWPNP